MNSEKKGVIKAMFIAIIITLGGLLVLGWQYRQIEEKRLPALEEELARQKIAIEKREAEDVLERFMSARINKDEMQAVLYLTEKAAAQKEADYFELINDYLSFKILDTQERPREEFRFVIGLYKKGIGEIIEIITVKKILKLDRYYIDSVERAG